MHAPRLSCALAGSLSLILAAAASAAPQETSARDLVRAGRDYQVRFEADGFTFVPSPGGRLERDRALGFRLQSVGRRDAAAAPPLVAAAPVADGNTVRYPRPGFVETYELRLAGVEQSFVFSTLPPGSGDLVVRGRLDTGMTLVTAASHGLRFEAANGRGVEIGAVTGIDADGRVAEGALRYADGVLELSLPASFVDTAALPLVLNPVIGTSIILGPGLNVDVAYSNLAGRYLAVWQNGSPPAVHGRLVNPDGTLPGASFQIVPAVPYQYGSEPRVASVQTGSAPFAVVCLGGVTTGNSTLLSKVDANGVVQGVLAVAGTTDLHASPDVGGDSTTTDDDVLVVFKNVTQGRIQLSRVDLGTLSTLSTINLTTTSTTDQNPSITPHGGVPGRWLVTWEREVAGAESDVWGVVVNRTPAMITAPFPIASAVRDEDDPEADGDGTNWTVTYEWEQMEGSGDNNIFCRGVTYNPVTGSTYLSPAPRIIEFDIGFDELDPAIAWTGESYLLTWADEFGVGDIDLYVKSLETVDCRDCEGEHQVAIQPWVEDQIRIASQRSGGSSGSEALIVYSEKLINNTRQVEVLLFGATDGVVADLGGGCAGGGTAGVTCALEGMGRFGMRVQHAAPTAVVALMLGATAINLPCGPCAIVPNPLVTLPASTDGNGDAFIGLQIAAGTGVVGATLYTQWAVLTPGGCVIALSNGHSVTIE